MEWTRSETLALAMPQCTQCRGSGLRLVKRGVLSPCNCVLRCIFRICYERFVKCATQERHVSRISLEPQAGRQRPNTWGRKDEEFIADFSLVSRRALSEEEYRLFRYHFLLGADWKLCTRKLQIDRGNFFHSVYRIEQKLRPQVSRVGALSLVSAGSTISMGRPRLQRFRRSSRRFRIRETALRPRVPPIGTTA